MVTFAAICVIIPSIMIFVACADASIITDNEKSVAVFKNFIGPAAFN